MYSRSKTWFIWTIIFFSLGVENLYAKEYCADSNQIVIYSDGSSSTLPSGFCLSLSGNYLIKDENDNIIVDNLNKDYKSVVKPNTSLSSEVSLKVNKESVKEEKNKIEINSNNVNTKSFGIIIFLLIALFIYWRLYV